MSHPTWVRGLKYIFGFYRGAKAPVAPHVGAWIEIASRKESIYCLEVAPHVGAWIEIYKGVYFNPLCCVAPHVGAWIEMIM